MSVTIGEKWISNMPSMDGWNAGEGKSTTIDAIRTVRQISVVPCNHGGIQLETHRDGFDIEIEIGPDGKIIGALVALDQKDSVPEVSPGAQQVEGASV